MGKTKLYNIKPIVNQKTKNHQLYC